MTPREVEHLGSALEADSYACGLTGYAYDEKYYSIPQYEKGVYCCRLCCCETPYFSMLRRECQALSSTKRVRLQRARRDVLRLVSD